MSVTVLYETKAVATGNREGDGMAETLDGSLKLNLAAPKELGGSGNGNNPEEIFAVGYAACFIGAMKAVASKSEYLKLPADAKATATVGIGPYSEGGYGLKVSLDVSLPGLEKAAAEELVQKAHEVCPYSNATRGNVDMELSVSV
ncbi:organic hydroperoxide resistance protein [Hyphomonas pacifica]|uniref:Uncharacterized protein n=1 Tax=Hyphomonas pacifica TaxID=1280941 RepID=A0A062TV57_9PROT|nr:organic hydroperoxide resistance protein [Hyphomonas pacifica]KCZ46798.1 hypothetical protein HY2_05255 [Hyphomonas pacifica]MBR9808909.1 organic hydroperoxide resistance protein [Alphaproteobacteria bacterium]RAN30414.1 hypothetical protein HY3_06225 [Hyphomonas pacifica]RAN31802.1 hypothetical protein HY11_06325 [Hyphomonas pacifica]